MSNLGLGKLITTPQVRDAIHVAVAPIVAACDLEPAEHVSLTADGRAQGCRALPKKDPIGIVDPFLTVRRVREGETFWLLLYENTVAGMRHHWEHPAFIQAAPIASDKRTAQKWLAEFCAEHNVPFDDLIDGVKEFVESTDKWSFRYVQQGSESLRDVGASPEFWNHFTAYTGIVPSAEKLQENPFCCSC